MKSSSLFLLVLSPLGVFGHGSRVSTDATCGSESGYTCLGSRWGDCCSQYGWCGSTTAYCGKGCQSKFGSCNAVTAPSVKISSSLSTKTPSSTRSSSTGPIESQKVTTDARCGPSFGGRTCMGSRWGSCCSQYSYCGSTKDYCNAKTCQKGYGKCDTASSSSKASSSTVRVSSTMASVTSVTSSSKPSSSTSTSSSSPSTTTSLPPPSTVSSSSSYTKDPSSSLSSSLSTSLSSSVSASVSPSPSPSAKLCPYTTVDNCTPYSGTFQNSCRGRPAVNDDHCMAGFQIHCARYVSKGTLIAEIRTYNDNDADLCVARCRSDASCVAANFYDDYDTTKFCQLYSAVQQYTDGNTNVYVKTCEGFQPAAPVASTFSTMSSVVVATTPSPSPTPTPTPTPTPVPCPYATIPNCRPYTGALTDVCPRNDPFTNNNKCSSGYQIRCGQRVNQGASIPQQDRSGPAAVCIEKCSANPLCTVAQWDADVESGGCDLYSRVDNYVQASGSEAYVRTCDGFVAPVGSSTAPPPAQFTGKKRGAWEMGGVPRTLREWVRSIFE